MRTLGEAKRDIQKNVRVATHEPVITLVCEQLQISHVIEDGMGISSTSLFHRLKVQNLLSFETREEWAKCQSCENDDKINHSIVVGRVDIEKISSDFIGNTTLAFVDGLTTDERFETLQKIVQLNPVAIIEHDAEAVNELQLQQRKILLKNYNIWQYVKLNPETFLCVRNDTKIDISSDFIQV